MQTKRTKEVWARFDRGRLSDEGLEVGPVLGTIAESRGDTGMEARDPD